ncbi:hypothetical protein Pint_27282 [Pistacia integerrima]|uniref:Uncharacterized protein n=1 Tax=Pistacia integerrima TaxID=434235 RepID=A0ACC0YQ29_9ROSI|nr:hypothetical protein Pint_27282 [Pistacia integerrima]
MGPSGTPVGSSQSVSSAVLQTNSAILGSQRGPVAPQATFSSVISPRAPYNMNLLGNNANISALLNQTFGNGAKNTGPSGLSGFHRGNTDAMSDSNSLSVVSTDVGFSASRSSIVAPNMANSGSSGQVQNQQMPNSSGNMMFLDQQQSQVQKFEQQNLQHAQQLMQQFPVSHGQPQPQQRHIQSNRGGFAGMNSIKLESQTMNDQIGPQQSLHSFRNSGPVKLELQQNQIGKGIGPVKLEPHLDQAMLLQQPQHHQQQQQQQQQLQQQQQQQQQQQYQEQPFPHLSGQSSQPAIPQINLLQQQRVLQMQQQQQQQQLLKALPQQRPQLQQQFQQHNLPSRSTKPVYEPGMCARRLTQYMYQQQQRPDDNNIEFWRKFVADFFAPNARKRWCVSLYGNNRQTNGVFPQKERLVFGQHETTVEVLPRLLKVKYDSGTLEELLYVDMPREYQNAMGQIVLDYAKAIQESVFEHLRVVRDGQLRIVFSPDLKICSWEFCARRHEELIPRRLIVPQVSQLGAAAQKYQASAQSGANSSTPDLLSNCNTFLASARQLAKTLEVPLVNDLGYTKRFVRCLQVYGILPLLSSHSF